MQEDEVQIRTLIERWAEAVHVGDTNLVLADHSDDIVMFDVPPPYDGVRGLDAYRETWPPFFEWQARGASFEIVSLDVTAGDEVAYAHALLRCGTPQELAENPATDPRLTKLSNQIAKTPDVKSVSPPALDKRGNAAVYTVISDSAPSDDRTEWSRRSAFERTSRPRLAVPRAVV